MATLIVDRKDRRVVQEGDRFIKLTADNKEFVICDAIVEKKLDPEGNRYVLWEEMKSFPASYGSHLQAIGGIGFVRSSPHSGINLSRLLHSDRKCKNCQRDETSPGQYRIAAEHVPRFIRHLLESVLILNKNGVHHSDLSLENIVVKPTETEEKEGVLRTSLPKIIDFGLSSLSSVKDDVAGLFNGCRHGLMFLEREGLHGGVKNEPNWIIEATLPSERESITPLLNMVTTEDAETILGWLV